MQQNIVKAIINSYSNFVVRLYCRIRFQIMRQVFLDEIGQYFRDSKNILDLGCGFGLFSLYFTKKHNNLKITGIDRSKNRINLASKAAEKLNIEDRASYLVGDVTELNIEDKFDAAYLLDIIHHIPTAEAEPLLKKLHTLIKTDGYLLVKDIAYYPTYKRWFTYILDKLMDYKTPVNYWQIDDLKKLLQNCGFEVFSHHMTDYLPYPHILYICKKV